MPSRFIWWRPGISWPSLNQIVCALRFFYGVTLGQATIPERIAYAREPQKLPVVLSADEVVRFLEAIPSLKSRTALTTVYAAGLRVSEVVMLKIADIDSGRMVIRVEQGKGGKDRYVMLSPQLLRSLRGAYWRLTRPIVPGGGPSFDGARWIASRPGFFLPVRVLFPAVPAAVPARPEERLRSRQAVLLRPSRRPR